MLCPAVIMLLIGSIKSTISSVITEEAVPDTDTPIVTYEVMQNATAFPNVLCYDNNMFIRWGENIGDPSYACTKITADVQTAIVAHTFRSIVC